jgi:hypothetical protein
MSTLIPLIPGVPLLVAGLLATVGPFTGRRVADAVAIATAIAVAVLALVVALALARGGLPRPARLAGLAGCTAVLALAVAALRGGPAAWRAPLAYVGEYPDAVDQVGAIPTFLRQFAVSVPTLPDFAAQHPPGATVFYLLVDRVWSGLTAATLATTMAAALGVLVVAGLARDELGSRSRIRGPGWLAAAVQLRHRGPSLQVGEARDRYMPDSLRVSGRRCRSGGPAPWRPWRWPAGPGRAWPGWAGRGGCRARTG